MSMGVEWLVLIAIAFMMVAALIAVEVRDLLDHGIDKHRMTPKTVYDDQVFLFKISISIEAFNGMHQRTGG